MFLHGYGKRNHKDFSKSGRFVSVLAFVLFNHVSDHDVSFPNVSFRYVFDGSTVSAIDVSIAHKAHIDKIVSNTGNNLKISSFDLTMPLPLRYTNTGIATSLRYWENRVIVNIVLLLKKLE